MAELWDLYDSEGNKTSEVITRTNDPLPAGKYHLVVHIWLYNTKGHLLIQKRANHVYWEPGRWATTGGSAMSGEDSLTAAIRETREELGIDLQADNMRLIDRVIRRESFTDIWIAETTALLSDCSLEDAVAEVKYVSSDALYEMIKAGSFIDYTQGEGYTDVIMQKISCIV